MLRVQSSGDASTWAVEHREALRAVVVEHGAVLVRGLGLTDAAEVGAVFRGLANGLMTEQEAFAPRQAYSDGVYSSMKWPANQQMCMHHELSYRLEFPGLLLFACLQAPTQGGATAVANSATVLDSLPAELVERFERDAGLDVALVTEGEERAVPPGVDLSAYRIVQEALTNTLKHGGPSARATVTLRYRPSQLEVEIVDDGRGPEARDLGGNGSGNGNGPGHGLIGMRERVALHGGQLRAGRRTGGGYAVRARFPLPGP